MRPFILGLAILCGVSSFAANQTNHELVASSTSGSLAFSDSGSAVSLGAAYHLTVIPGFQLGLAGNLLRVGASGTSTTEATLLFGPTLNFPMSGWLGDAIFWNAGVGLFHLGTTRFLFQTTLGKRFHLVGPLTYRPAMGIQVIEGGSLTFLFQILSLSALF